MIQVEDAKMIFLDANAFYSYYGRSKLGMTSGETSHLPVFGSCHSGDWSADKQQQNLHHRSSAWQVGSPHGGQAARFHQGWVSW